jgi:hypothetical protein
MYLWETNHISLALLPHDYGLAPKFSLRNLMSTWNPQFEPFLDEDQWSLYEGPKYVTDLGLLWKSRGSRRRKRFKMDMDRAEKGRSTTSKVGTHFVEDTQRSCCSMCHKPRHNRRKCPDLFREHVSNVFVCWLVCSFLLFFMINVSICCWLLCIV